MASPVVPQRPARSQQLAPSLATDMPTIPPRPARTNQSRSRSRDNYARSPLNESPFAGNVPPTSASLAPGEQPRLVRPPSVQSLPLIGQEGDEYASLESIQNASAAAATAAASPNVTSNVAGDLPLHAPKASTPAAVAKSKISTVTHTDSVAAAAAGIGMPHNEPEEPDRSYRPPSAKPYSARPPSSYSNERPGSTPRASSIHEGEGNVHGIPAIGIQVPMYPNAGDVQAPSPAPVSAGPATGVGFFNDGRHGASLGRRKSRDVFARPPDAYGLHGHGSAPADQFERAWYQRHPEEASKEEHGAYGPGAHQERGLWALSSEDLNKIVHSKGTGGMATIPTAVGIPPESIGYMASEEYASRMSSPRPPSVHSKSRTGSQTHAESPLRRTSFQQGDYSMGSPTTGAFARPPSTDNAVDSELEDDTIHLNAPARRSGKFTGNGYDPPVEDLGVHGGNTDEQGGWIDERGYGVPILASDEIAKDPAAEYMLPAVDPEQEQRGDHYYDFEHYSAHAGAWRSGPSSRPGSRPSSRPGSVHGAPISLSRFVSRDDHDKTGTPLEEIEEYEPLFGEDDTGAAQKRPATLADRFKRPDLELRRFPSSDIWEDTPNSLQLQTTVDSEQAPEERALHAAPPAAVFESPEKEHLRQGKVTEHQRQKSSVDSTYKHRFKAGVQEEMATRPGLAPRFPSQDIWEDTPDSAMMQTTVGDALTSPEAAQVAAAPIATAATAVVAQPHQVHVSTSPEAHGQPSIPARPAGRSRDIAAAAADEPEEPLTQMTSAERRAPPTVPGRPKPQIPARPPRTKLSPPAAGDASYAATTTSPPKPKPAVPARPAQGKLANLKAGFMDTLNSRLSKGPPAAPVSQARGVDDDDQQQQPRAPISLSDARKGRARGPVRRRPAGHSADAAAGAKPASPWGMSKLSHVWSIPPEGVLAVSSGAEAEAEADAADKSVDEAAVATAPAQQAATLPEEISTASLTTTDATGDAIAHAASTAAADEEEVTPATAAAEEAKDLPEEISTASLTTTDATGDAIAHAAASS